MDAEDTAYEVLLNASIPPTFAIRSTTHGPDLIPASLRLAGAEQTLASEIGRESLLRDALRHIAASYDAIIVDTPPSLGLLTTNALCAADHLLVPLQAHKLAASAVTQLEQTVTKMRRINPALTIDGIAITMRDGRTRVASDVEDQARARYGATVFRAAIPATVRAIEAPAAGTPLLTYAPETPGATAYAALADELIGRWLPVETQAAQGGHHA